LPPQFANSVFINCPFDDDFAPILQAVAFCVVLLGFNPRLAPENADNAATRLDRIGDLIKESKFAIHDISRCKSTKKGEFARLNMPFELGLDHACCRFGKRPFSDKQILILEETQYDYQKALSDIAGWDIRFHKNNYEKAISHVRSWLISQAGAERVGLTRIIGKYAAFQEWYWERELNLGSSEDDIREYPNVEVIQAMHDWMEAGQPT